MGEVVPLLAHSPLGASSAERWLACPGSAALTNILKADPGYEEHEDPDYRRDGVEAHDLANHCLQDEIDTWEADPEKFPHLTCEMMSAVQTYLDYVRSLPGQIKVSEMKLHLPEFHQLCYGTVDFAAVATAEGLRIVDYKHGVGLVVEVKDNPQIMYYAFMLIEQMGAFADDEAITLTICQPRVSWHPDGPIRSWQTTVGYIRSWAYDTLRPAMERVNLEAYLSTGDHCRFCPAKLVCPAILGVGSRFAKLTADDIKNASAALLADLLGQVPVLKMLATALTAEAKRRMITNRGELPGWKVVPAIAHRVWKDNAPVVEQFGEEAYKPRAILSPPQVEETLTGGKEFVHEWAFRPDAGYDIVAATDRRHAVKFEAAEDKWKGFVKTMLQESLNDR